jgi:hypothetical protein
VKLGLWLNLPRVRMQAAVAVANGLSAALGLEDLDRLWADAVASSEEEADYLHWKANADRMTARVKSKLGMGHG